MKKSDNQLLTEYLGECWHQLAPPTYFPDYAGTGDTRCVSHEFCKNCGKYIPIGHWRLHFDDWRNIGRLIEKLHDEENIEYELMTELGCAIFSKEDNKGKIYRAFINWIKSK